MSACRKVLTPEGRLGAVGGGGGRWFGPMGHQLRAAGTSLVASQSMFPVSDNPNKDLSFLKKLIEAGQVTPVIDRTYSLDEASEAMAYLEQGHVRGKIAIAVSEPDG